MRAIGESTKKININPSSKNINQEQSNQARSRTQLLENQSDHLHLALATAIKQRQQDLIQEDECKAKLIQNKYRSARSQQSNILENDESRSEFKQNKYESVSKGYRLKQWESFLLLFLVLVTFLILFILDWIDLDDKDKYMGDSKFPWGIMYIIFTLPIIIIQLANYNIQSQKEKELNVLIYDYKKMQATIGATVPNLDIQETQCDIQSFINYMLTLFLLLFQFFSAGRANVIFQMVGLQFLGDFYKNIQRVSSYQLLKFQELYEIENQNFVEEYSEIWDLKPLQQHQITQQDQQSIYLEIYHRIINKLVVISDQILHSDGNQIALIFFDLRMKFYLFTKVTFLIVIATVFGYSLQSKSIKDNNQNDQFFSLNFFPLLIIIIYQFADDMLIDPKIYEYFQQVENLDYIRRTGGIKDDQIKYIDVHGEIIRKFYNQQYFVQFFILLIQLTCMKYSSNQDGFFNIFALNYLLRMDLIGLDRYFYSLDIDDFRRIVITDYKYPMALRYKSFDQYYCYILELDVDIESIQQTPLDNPRISELLYNKLKELSYQLMQEDGMMIQLLEYSYTLKIKLLILLIEIGYCAMILEDKITVWSEKSIEDKLANGHFPWGVIYIIFTIPVLIIQGLGNSEEIGTFKKYISLRKQFFKYREGTISERVFEWDDYDKIYCQINNFNKVQAIILIIFLLLIQLFSFYAYEMLQNIVALEFLYYLDEHALGTLSRYYYKYDNLQHSNREIKIPGQEQDTFDKKYRFIWRI